MDPSCLDQGRLNKGQMLLMLLGCTCKDSRTSLHQLLMQDMQSVLLMLVVHYGKSG